MSRRMRVDGVRRPSLTSCTWRAIRRSATYQLTVSMGSVGVRLCLFLRYFVIEAVMFIFACPVNCIVVARTTPLLSYPSLLALVCTIFPAFFCFLRFFDLCSGVSRWPCWWVVYVGSIKSAWVLSWWFGFAHRCSRYMLSVWFFFCCVQQLIVFVVCAVYSRLITYMVLLDYNYNLPAIQDDRSRLVLL